MPLSLITLPCLQDNYVYLLHDPDTDDTALVDASEAAPVLAALQARDWRLREILLTHHHHDHIAGLAEIVAATGAQVLGAASDRHRLPPLDRALAAGDSLRVGSEDGTVLAVPGHTTGHIAFHFPSAGLCFTADSLMAGGCGRLFEGSPEVAHASLMRLAALPGDPLICSGHEYTASNLAFAATVEPDNAALTARVRATAEARRAGHPTVPSRLSLERATNPFLRCAEPAIARALGLSGADPVTVFARLRAQKDLF